MTNEKNYCYIGTSDVSIVDIWKFRSWFQKFVNSLQMKNSLFFIPYITFFGWQLTKEIAPQKSQEPHSMVYYQKLKDVTDAEEGSNRNFRNFLSHFPPRKCRRYVKNSFALSLSAPLQIQKWIFVAWTCTEKKYIKRSRSESKQRCAATQWNWRHTNTHSVAPCRRKKQCQQMKTSVFHLIKQPMNGKGDRKNAFAFSHTAYLGSDIIPSKLAQHFQRVLWSGGLHVWRHWLNVAEKDFSLCKYT